MQRIAISVFSLLLSGVLSAALCANAPRNQLASTNETEPSECITEAALHITANPTAVTVGQSSALNWSARIPDGCLDVHLRLNGQPVPNSGTMSVTPGRTTMYSLIVSETRFGVYSEKKATAVVSVGYPPRVVIDPGTPDPVRVLLGALIDSTNPEQTVELCNVDLDLTGINQIVIGDNRSLIASPACARGPRQFGPRIFVTDARGNLPLFAIRGDNVLIAGFRLEGPTDGIAQGDRKEKGIVIDPFGFAEPIHHIEISNMEIFHWSGVGVQVTDNTESAERGRLFNTNPGAVIVKGNYFHHNRHGAGEGYGVESAGGAYVTIEQNVFDENRHAIAGGSRNGNGRDYSGYTARDNLILSGGGLHCSESWFWTFTGWRFNCWHTHQIDMHGDDNAWYSDNNWECGTAGETMIIQRNTILYTAGHAIKIRGNPADKAVVDGNVFRNGDRGDAIAQNGACGWGDNITNPIQVLPNNVFGADPTAELGSCDFFGDGQQDQFMATGVTWWAKSPVTQQWRYLNTMPEKLSELQLRKIDGDTVCDVAPRTRYPWVTPARYSKSGTGPWVPLFVNEH